MIFLRSNLGSIFLLAAMLAGCGVDDAVKKIGQVILDPQIEVGPPEENPATLVVHAYSSADVNPNFQGDAAPLAIKIVALGSDHLFMSSDFFSLTFDLEESLGKTYVDLLAEEQINPDNYAALGPYELPKGTRKLGILAEFVDIETTSWRDTISVSDIGGGIGVALVALEGEIRLIKQEQ